MTIISPGMVEYAISVVGGVAGSIVRVLHAPPAPGQEWTVRSVSAAIAGGVLGSAALAPALVWWFASDWPDVARVAAASGVGFGLGYAGMVLFPAVIETAVGWLRDWGDLDKDGIEK